MTDEQRWEAYTKHGGPLQPQYATLEARLRAFSNWPSTVRQQPMELADAGFYYRGQSDWVKCFHCDKTCVNWEAEDVPWVEHARWMPRCIFIKQAKRDGMGMEEPPKDTHS